MEQRGLARQASNAARVCKTLKSSEALLITRAYNRVRYGGQRLSATEKKEVERALFALEASHRLAQINTNEESRIYQSWMSQEPRRQRGHDGPAQTKRLSDHSRCRRRGYGCRKHVWFYRLSEEGIDRHDPRSGATQTNGQAKRLIVAGCLVERYRDELKAEIPEVDAFIGTSQINDILAVCDPKTNTRSLPVVPLGNQSATYLYDESTPRVLATPSHYAFVKIAEGCDRPCAFCFIPQMRGHFRSRRFGSIIAEAHQLAEEGVKEIILVAQDSSRYGEDLGKQDALARLLRELAHVDGIEWVRVMYTYPTHISDAFLDVLAEEPKAVKYLDMPLQHARKMF